MSVELYYCNYSGDRGPHILYSKATCWPAVSESVTANRVLLPSEMPWQKQTEIVAYIGMKQCQKQYVSWVCCNFILNTVEGLRIGGHRIQPTVLVVPPAHPRKKSLQEGKLGTGLMMCMAYWG